MKNKSTLIIFTLLLLTQYFFPDLCLSENILQKLRENQMDMQNQLQKAQKKDLEQYSTARQKQAVNFHNAFEKQGKEFLLLKNRVEKLWPRIILNSKNNWVKYNPKANTKSEVDFENGTITLEVVVEDSKVDKATSLEIAEITKSSMKSQLAGLMATGVLDRQIADNNNAAISNKQAVNFLNRDLANNLTVNRKIVIGKDGVKRRIVQYKFNMIQDHVLIRAENYLTTVSKYAREKKLDPALILAIIHTESHFNPLAVSHCHAYGLMQIIPRFAGLEANRILGRNFIPDKKALLDPATNIQMGCVYFSRLVYRYFSNYEYPANLYFSIAGYNWGTRMVKQRIIKQYLPDTRDGDHVYLTLKKHSPNETKLYLEKVLLRKKVIWDKIVKEYSL